MKSNYFEADRGKFDSTLVRDDGCYGKIAVAYTCGDDVRLSIGYCEADRDAVEEFADQYGLTVDWERWQQ